MESSARQDYGNVLITNVSSLLGRELARFFLKTDASVFGVDKHHPKPDIIASRGFTFLDLDLSQPLPAYLPKIDLIFHLLGDTFSLHQFSSPVDISPQTTSLTNYVQNFSAELFLISPLRVDTNILEKMSASAQKGKVKITLFGDLYGEGMDLPHQKDDNELAYLVSQAIRTDKVILENEGLDLIYPAYIDDVISQMEKILKSAKDINFLLSQPPLNALSIAYEIQNAARLSLGRELGLFFRQNPNPAQHEAVVSPHNWHHEKTTPLEEGLRKTFDYFAQQNFAFADQELKDESHPKIKETARTPIYQHQATEKRRPSMPSLPQIKLPTFSLRNRKALFIPLIIILLFFMKTVLDVTLSWTNLRSGQRALVSGDFEKSKKKFQSAKNHLSSFDQEVRWILAPASFTKKTKSLENLTLAAQKSAQGLFYFASATQNLSKNLAALTVKDSKENFDLEPAQVNFRRAYLETSQAQELTKVNSPIFKSKVASLQTKINDLNSLSLAAFEFVNLLPNLTGPATKSYLILLENNNELRPGGGFIGNWGLVNFEDNHLKNISVDDIYTIDGQLQEKIEPPKELKEKLGVDRFYLRDSDWSPDFSLNVQTARDFFRKETGKNVQGVIAFDLTFVQNLLAKLGPITLEDYKETITGDNLFEKGQYYSEVGFFPGSTQKRDFFGALTRKLLEKVLTDLGSDNKSALIALTQTAKDATAQKHLMFSFDDPVISVYQKTKGWDNLLPPSSFNPQDDSFETRDFLAISEANLGANKVNRFLERKISYEVTIGRDADLVATLKITYTNNSIADTWPGGKYVNFLRIYVPLASSLFQYQNGDKTDIKEVKGENQNNLTVISTYVEVPPKSTKDVIFTYRIPKNIKLETAPVYHLYVDKQPGTNRDQLDFKFNLPAYLAVKSINGQEVLPTQNSSLTTNLLTDRQFQIEVAKK